jgi:uncharacterized protein YrrD
MRLGSEFIGKPIISMDNGRNVGSVKDLYFDQSLEALAGIFLGSEGLIKRISRFIDARDVVVLGQDAILVSRSEVTMDSETSVAYSDWLRREPLAGRTIKTSGGTLIGSIGDVYLAFSGEVRALALAKVQIEGPVSSAGYIVRSAVLEVGDDEGFMIVDLSKAEQHGGDAEPNGRCGLKIGDQS